MNVFMSIYALSLITINNKISYFHLSVKALSVMKVVDHVLRTFNCRTHIKTKVKKVNGKPLIPPFLIIHHPFPFQKGWELAL